MRPTYIEGDYTISPAFENQSRLVYGLGGIGGIWGTVKEGESIDAILYALENGISVFDTAPSYGDSESFFGKALKQWVGAKPFISTKVGRLRGKNAFDYNLDFSSEGIKRSLQNSLETIGVDSIDLLFLHEPHLVPLENMGVILETLSYFKEQGLVKQLGVGGNPSKDFMPFVKRENFDVVSGFLHLNACNLSAFNGEIQMYKREGMLYYAASPLHFGLLGNRLDSYNKNGVDGKWITEKDLQNAVAVKEIADENEIPLPTLAHRYLFSVNEADRIVIGAKNLQEIQSSIIDWQSGKLTKKLFNQITDTICEA
ncbi:MAG: aldo/keto reductase [Allomuricauda sp.]